MAYKEAEKKATSYHPMELIGMVTGYKPQIDALRKEGWSDNVIADKIESSLKETIESFNGVTSDYTAIVDTLKKDISILKTGGLDSFLEKAWTPKFMEGYMKEIGSLQGRLEEVAGLKVDPEALSELYKNSALRGFDTLAIISDVTGIEPKKEVLQELYKKFFQGHSIEEIKDEINRSKRL